MRWRSLVLTLCIAMRCFAQNGLTGHPDWYIKPAFQQGYIMVHRISIGHLVHGYPSIYELNLVKPTLGNKLWQLENNKPDIGITAQCLDYKNPSQLGYAYALAPFVEIPLSGMDQRNATVLRLCWGAAYLTKPFDIVTNHKNVAIGSHWNTYVQVKLFWHVKLNQNLRFEPGFGITHASNGKFKNPNLGLNVVTLNAAMNFRIAGKTPSPIERIDSSTKARRKNELLFFAAIGFNQPLMNSAMTRVLSAGAQYQHNIRNTQKLTAGINVFLDENYLQDYYNRHETDLQGLNKVRASLMIGYAYNIGRLSLPIEVGYYVFQKQATIDGDIVSRVGMRYYFPKGLVANFSLRSHLAVAYNFEFGLGYRLYVGKH